MTPERVTFTNSNANAENDTSESPQMSECAKHHIDVNLHSVIFPCTDTCENAR